MASTDIFNDALGLDDWIWFIIIGVVGLFVLLLLICCCICVKRAKRKGREEALAGITVEQNGPNRRPNNQQPSTQYVPTTRNIPEKQIPLTAYQNQQYPYAVSHPVNPKDNTVLPPPNRGDYDGSSNNLLKNDVYPYHQMASPSNVSVHSSSKNGSNAVTSSSTLAGSSTLKDRIHALRQRSSLSDGKQPDSLLDPNLQED